MVCWGGDLAGNIEGRNLSKKYFFLREFGVVRQWGGILLDPNLKITCFSTSIQVV